MAAPAPRARARRIVAGLAIVAASTALAACAAPGEADAPAPALRAAIVQERADVAAGVVSIEIANDAEAEVVVDHAEYRSSALVEPLVAGDDSRIPPGATRALRGELPAPTCDDAPVDDEVVVVLEGGREVALDPSDPYGQVVGLTDVACVRAAVAEVADVTTSVRIPADADEPAILRIEVVRTGAGSLEVLGIASTPLLALVDADGERAASLPIALEPDAAGALAAEVPLRPARCDAHAIAEDKQGTLWRLDVRVDGATETLVLPAADDDRGALLAYVAAACGLA